MGNDDAGEQDKGPDKGRGVEGMSKRKLTKKDKRKWAKIPIFNNEYYVIAVFGNPKTIALCLEAWHYPKNP